jgi:hypothetical protein
MGDISKGVANSLLPAKKIYEKNRKKFRMKRLRTFRTGVLSYLHS